MRDTNFAEEAVFRIDKEVDKVFPEFRKLFNSSSNEERKKFLKLLDDTLFEGDLKTSRCNIKEKCFNDCYKKNG